jgi:hypothetical protein
VDQEACSVLAATGREEGVQAWTDGTAAGGEVAQQICAPAGLPSADWQGPGIPRSTVVLLGGFVTSLQRTDFWCLTIISMIQLARSVRITFNFATPIDFNSRT